MSDAGDYVPEALTLNNDFSQSVRGYGMGIRNTCDLELRVYNQDVFGQLNATDDHHVVNFLAYDEDNPGLTYDLLLAFISKGLFLFSAQHDETIPMYTVNGPPQITVAGTHPSLIDEPGGQYPGIPKHQISARYDNGTFEVGREIKWTDTTGDGTTHLATITSINSGDASWLQREDVTQGWTIKVTVQLNPNFVTTEDDSVDLTSGAKYFASSSNKEFTEHFHGYTGLSENKPITKYDSATIRPDGERMGDLNVNVLAKTDRQESVLRRGVDEITSVFTVNDMYQRYNLPEETDHSDDPVDSLWYLGTAADGGFEIRLPTNKLHYFRISAPFVEALGLSTDLTVVGNLKDKVEDLRLIVQPWNIDLQRPKKPSLFLSVLDIDELDPKNVVISLLDQNSGNYTDISGYTLAQFIALVPDSDEDLYDDDAPPVLIRVGDTFYRLIDVRDDGHTKHKKSIVKVPGVKLTDAAGIDYWEWQKPPPGSYITNTSTISVESFSLFSDIRVVVPVGCSFTPMMVQNSSGIRVLAEFRIPFQYSVSSARSGVPQITNSVFTGDLIWNRSGGSQYLKITSASKVYQIIVNAEAVYRDPNHQPPTRKIYLPKRGLFEVKLRWLTRK